jgi:uncharacterized protein DUF2628
MTGAGASEGPRLDPYAPPRADTSLAAGETPELTDDEINVFVGDSAGYYREKWFDAVRSGGSYSGFNWASAFVSYLWLLYRRMYLECGVLFAGSSLLGTALGFLVGRLHLTRVGLINPLANIALGALMGFLGNALYLRRARAAVRRVRLETPDPQQRLALLARQGGVSGAALTLGILARVALLAFMMSRR